MTETIPWYGYLFLTADDSAAGDWDTIRQLNDWEGFPPSFSAGQMFLLISRLFKTTES